VSRLRRFARWFVATTSTVEPPTAMALVRIGVGVSLILLLAPMLFTSVGHDVVVFSFCDVDAGGYRDLKGTWAIDLVGGPVPGAVFGLFGVAFAAAVAMVVGVLGRVPVVVAAVCTRVVFGQNGDVSGAGDALIGNALLLLVFADCTATLSLDCRLRTGSFVDDTPLPAWPRKLALLQLCVVYTATGLQKLVSTSWTPLDGFSALYQILQSPHWARFPDLVVDAGGALRLPLAVLTAVTIVWEVSFVVVLWKWRWRPLYAVIGVGIHLGILVLMEVGIFSVASLALYPVLFSPQLVAAVRERAARWRAPPPPPPVA
jgi:hypothetical protein